MRRFEDPPIRGQKYTARPGAYAILRRGEDVLLTYQGAPHHEFQLPGGGIDPGEHPIPALHREIFEETGWHVRNLRFLGAFRRFVFMPEYDIYAEKICQIYTGTPTLRISDPIETDHTDIWVPADTAVGILANEGDRHFLRHSFGLP